MLQRHGKTGVFFYETDVPVVNLAQSFILCKYQARTVQKDLTFNPTRRLGLNSEISLINLSKPQ